MILSYQGNDIEQRDVDGYVNLTQMAKPFGKRVNDWSRTESAKAYLEATFSVTGICVAELLLQTSSNPTLTQGTWAHPLVAIAFAQWLNPHFHVWCNIHIKQIIEEQAKPQPKPVIEPEKVNAEVATAYTQAIYTLQDNGDVRLAALLKTKFGNVLQADLEWQALPAVEERVEGAVECAIRLGFTVPKNYESTLGKYVKQCCGHLLLGQNQRFSYTSNQSVPANMYPFGNPEVEKAVRSFCVLKAFSCRLIQGME